MSELELTPSQGGTLLRVRVSAGGRRDAILGVHGGALKLSVAAAPERGRANRAVCELLASALGLPAGSIQLVAGAKARDKRLRLPLAPAVVAERLALLIH
ncbi:MAG TPA: DUF167 domain-containing protein [Candidatus Polarisedimenticolaceae bacterium]|nr:DUF167 domain-containing protein [Candidatus Polarisedimenticolaceae bacterium]